MRFEIPYEAGDKSAYNSVMALIVGKKNLSSGHTSSLDRVITQSWVKTIVFAILFAASLLEYFFLLKNATIVCMAIFSLLLSLLHALLTIAVCATKRRLLGAYESGKCGRFILDENGFQDFDALGNRVICTWDQYEFSAQTEVAVVLFFTDRYFYCRYETQTVAALKNALAQLVPNQAWYMMKIKK